ncbi:MAG: protein-glutamate O-methyltransferase CheR [Bacteroidetes bacterium]|nr:MAG: protein-glutamate O-methyltransferase CheR [Bacteroidota bacterium]
MSIKTKEPGISSSSLSKFLHLLSREFGVDYSGYSPSFVARRLQGLLNALRLDSLEIFICYIRQRPETLAEIQRELSINYTEMFRNPGFFYSMRKKVFPFLATYPTLKIWHAGCSTGEEVFSLAILLQEVGLLDRTKIYATDKDTSVLDKAASAIFDTSRMQEYTANYYSSGGNAEFSNYYSSGYGQLKFQESIRRKVSFQQHDLISDDPINKFNLILCRNVMIYFSPDLQNKVVGSLCSSLSNLGYLGLGATETLSFNKHRHEFAAIDKSERIYRKVSLSEWRNCKN